jgi:hypothetical protein
MSLLQHFLIGLTIGVAVGVAWQCGEIFKDKGRHGGWVVTAIAMTAYAAIRLIEEFAK